MARACCGSHMNGWRALYPMPGFSCARPGHMRIVVARQLPELPEENLLGEPVGRDSLSAVAWSAAVLERRDPEAVVAMLSADHIITPAEEFRATLELAFEVA